MIQCQSPEVRKQAAEGINKASESAQDIRGAYVDEQMVRVEGGEIVEYRTDLKVTFVLE